MNIQIRVPRIEKTQYMAALLHHYLLRSNVAPTQKGAQEQTAPHPGHSQLPSPVGASWGRGKERGGRADSLDLLRGHNGVCSVISHYPSIVLVFQEGRIERQRRVDCR